MRKGYHGTTVLTSPNLKSPSSTFTSFLYYQMMTATEWINYFNTNTIVQYKYKMAIFLILLLLVDAIFLCRTFPYTIVISEIIFTQERQNQRLRISSDGVQGVLTPNMASWIVNIFHWRSLRKWQKQEGHFDVPPACLPWDRTQKPHVRGFLPIPREKKHPDLQRERDAKRNAN